MLRFKDIRVSGSGRRIQCSGLDVKVQGLRFGFSGSGCMVQVLEFKVED